LQLSGDTVMPLTDTAIRTAKPADKPRKMADEKGLYLLLQPTGGRLWRFDYRFEGKRKTLALGAYPDVTLKAARERLGDARTLLADGVDPSLNRKAQNAAKATSAANSFEVVAREWFAKFKPQWTDGHSEKILARLERDIFPWVGGRPIADVKAPEILACLRRVEKRGAIETAHRALQNCGQVFRYGIATGRVERDIAADLRGALPPVKQTHRAAITEPKAIGELMRAIDGYSGSLVTVCAMKLAPLVFLRPGELRQAQWSEIDLDRAEWNIPAERMKMREPHLVPLSTQAITILREIQALTGDGTYIFPSPRTRSRPMSNNAILSALRRMGYAKEEMSGHGFRAMARTILDEVLNIRPDYIEHQLAHAVKDPNGRAYNRTAHLAERRAMMQQWSDYLDKLKAGADVIPLHGEAA
jgi:integrase